MILAVTTSSNLIEHLQGPAEGLQEALLQDMGLIGYALSQSSVVTLLQGACLCAWPKFGARFTSYLCRLTIQPVSSSDSHNNNKVIMECCILANTITCGHGRLYLLNPVLWLTWQERWKIPCNVNNRKFCQLCARPDNKNM